MTSELRHGTWWRRWADVAAKPSQEDFDGRYFRMYDLEVTPFAADDLAALATAMTAKPEGSQTAESRRDPEENEGIPAIYTYFGQFIDHDLTLDPTSNLLSKPMTPQQLADLKNFRTPRFDLDCLYGRGPSDQPYLYEADGVRLVLGEPMSGNPQDADSHDLPRAGNGRALIGDPRNDENRIVSQLQATMLRFHNAVARRMAQEQAVAIGELDLAAVQQRVRHHYQWIVVHDFLPTIVQRSVLAEILPHLGGPGHAPAGNAQQPRFGVVDLPTKMIGHMPVEFSVAAYRFGHSMIRPIYRINQTIERRQIFSKSHDLGGDLGGMRPIPTDWAVDWQYFLDLGLPSVDEGGDDAVVRRPQFSYKIDTSLVSPLALLPPDIAVDPSSLALRNLLRGNAFGLPTGEQIAAAMGITALTPDQVTIGKATHDDADAAVPISSIASGAFVGRTPLWTYVLAEAWQTSWAASPGVTGKARNAIPVRLGPVGGHLVAETILAALVADPDSYLHHAFAPDLGDGTGFDLRDLITLAIAPVVIDVTEGAAVPA